MPIAFKWLNRSDASGPKLGTTVRTIYTAGAGVTAQVKEITLVNLTASGVTATVYAVKSGGAAADYALINAEDLLAYETKVYSLGTVLEAGDNLQALCSVANAVSIHVSGMEVS